MKIKEANIWCLLSWNKIQDDILKFQRKIYSAYLLGETARVNFLQKKLSNSSLLRLWIIYLLYKYNQNYPSNSQIKYIYSQLLHNKSNFHVCNNFNMIIKKGYLILTYLILLPIWRAIKKKENQRFLSISSSFYYIKNISEKYSQPNSKYLLNFNLNKYLKILTPQTIRTRIFQYCHFRISNKIAYLLHDEILHNYSNKFYIGYMSRISSSIQTRASKLFIDILFYHFTKMLVKYDQIKKTLVFKSKINQVNRNYYYQYLYNITIISNSEQCLKEFQFLLICWFKKFNINFLKICILSTKNEILGYSLNKVYLNHQVIIQLKPSVKSQLYLLKILSYVNKTMRNVHLYRYIQTISVILKRWKNYFYLCNCQYIFKQLDNKIFQKIRSWIMRRHPKWSKQQIYAKYFPQYSSIKYHKKIYKNKWILSEINSQDKTEIIFLEKLTWKHFSTNRICQNNFKYLNLMYLY